MACNNPNQSGQPLRWPISPDLRTLCKNYIRAKEKNNGICTLEETAHEVSNSQDEYIAHICDGIVSSLHKFGNYGLIWTDISSEKQLRSKARNDLLRLLGPFLPRHSHHESTTFHAKNSHHEPNIVLPEHTEPSETPPVSTRQCEVRSSAPWICSDFSNLKELSHLLYHAARDSGMDVRDDKHICVWL